MVDILAIISRAFFEDQALRYGELLDLGDVWEIDRYISTNRALEKLREGGRMFLVTVRDDEQLWLVGVLDAPALPGVGVGRACAEQRPHHQHHPASRLDRLRFGQRHRAGLRRPRDEPPDTARAVSRIGCGDPRGGVRREARRSPGRHDHPRRWAPERNVGSARGGLATRDPPASAREGGGRVGDGRRGEEAKLKIRFETETRVFLAKFVTPIA